MPLRPRIDAQTVAPSSIVASASAGELGELFEYRIAQPVTIRKSESAMLPFLQQPIEGAQAADLFRPQLAASHQRRRADQLPAARRWMAARSRSTTAAPTAAKR